MEDADFSGYATKAGLKCSDGRTIMPEAFQDMDGKKVPLVWQHGHNESTNVLGHAILEAREDGVYAYAFCNDTTQGENARKLVQHGDIVSMSIYANQLVERSKQVFHGVIREVSLVLSGANPGALIDNVRLAHSDGDIIDELEDEAVIFSGATLEHVASEEDENLDVNDDDDDDYEDFDEDEDFEDDEDFDDDEDFEDDYESDEDFDDYESDEDFDDQEDTEMAQSAMSHADGEMTLKDIYDSLTPEQLDLLHYMIGAAVEDAKGGSAQHSDNDYYMEGADDMGRNIFESNAGYTGDTLSHADVQGIVATAIRGGSLKEAVEDYALKHGIENIDILFPDARAVANTPEFLSRRAEWVSQVLGAVQKSPFSRIKSVTADLTHEEARARGYIKGNMKKEEFFGLAKRVTTPTTIYKKQKLDRDDIVDITDFDVVSWLKAEMRLMMDEELARAILIGDGRPVDSEDKIRDPQGTLEGAGIRSILHDHDLYAIKVNVDVTDTTTMVDSIVTQRGQYRGSGVPTLYTSESRLTSMLLGRDKMGRRLYRNQAELADELRVANIVPIELLEAETNLVGIIVNLGDYRLGADKGGELSMFDDFDIDYNQYKYLMETRLSGALTKMRSALVLREGGAAAVTTNQWNTTDGRPDQPLWDGTTIVVPNDDFVYEFYNTTDATDIGIVAGDRSLTVDPGDTVSMIIWDPGTTAESIAAGTATRSFRQKYLYTGGDTAVGMQLD